MEFLIPLAILLGIVAAAAGAVSLRDPNRKARKAMEQWQADNSHPTATTPYCVHGVLKRRDCPECAKAFGRSVR